jgi:hypothetical protein
MENRNERGEGGSIPRLQSGPLGPNMGYTQSVADP